MEKEESDANVDKDVRVAVGWVGGPSPPTRTEGSKERHPVVVAAGENAPKSLVSRLLSSLL